MRYPCDLENRLHDRLARGDLDGVRSASSRLGQELRSKAELADELLVPLLHSCLWRVRETLEDLFGEVRGLPGREELARALAGREEARIVDRFERLVGAMIEAARAADDHAASAAHRARCFIDESFTSPTVSTAEVARAAACSEAHLCVLFRRAYGTTVGDYIRWRRVERSKVLLTTTSRPVKTVGYESGFGTYRTFLRNFRGLAGMSPRSYRRLAERGMAPVASDADEDVPFTPEIPELGQDAKSDERTGASFENSRH